MTCKARREGDELVCWQCRLRWAVEEPTPEACQERDEPPHKRDNSQLMFALARVAIRTPERFDHEQLIAVTNALSFWENPAMSQHYKDRALNYALSLVPGVAASIRGDNDDG